MRRLRNLLSADLRIARTADRNVLIKWDRCMPNWPYHPVRLQIRSTSGPAAETGHKELETQTARFFQFLGDSG